LREPAQIHVDTWEEQSNERMQNLFPSGAIGDVQAMF
jgi:hypothetical protein